MALNIEVFVKHLRENAHPSVSNGKCGIYVRQALQAAGASIPRPYPPTGEAYGPTLRMLGFHEIVVDNPDTFHFRRGDVMVMDSYKGNGGEGHVAGYDGQVWISDFIQRDFWAGPSYRTVRPRYAVFRY